MGDRLGERTRAAGQRFEWAVDVSPFTLRLTKLVEEEQQQACLAIGGRVSGVRELGGAPGNVYGAYGGYLSYFFCSPLGSGGGPSDHIVSFGYTGESMRKSLFTTAHLRWRFGGQWSVREESFSSDHSLALVIPLYVKEQSMSADELRETALSLEFRTGFSVRLVEKGEFIGVFDFMPIAVLLTWSSGDVKLQPAAKRDSGD